MSNITDEHRNRLGWLVEAAKRDGLALLEVNETDTGKPAVIVVAFDRDGEGAGAGGRMAPLARIDVDFAKEFTPPDGVEQVNAETGLDNAGEGC